MVTFEQDVTSQLQTPPPLSCYIDSKLLRVYTNRVYSRCVDWNQAFIHLEREKLVKFFKYIYWLLVVTFIFVFQTGPSHICVRHSYVGKHGPPFSTATQPSGAFPPWDSYSSL